MKTDPEIPINTPSWLGIGAILAAIGASACCVGPFLLLSLGIGGAWISTLTGLEPVRPFFIILTLFFIGLGYRKLYLTPDRCEVDEICAISDIQRRQRLMFWLGSAFILILLAFPWLAPFFMA
ncbi:mercuric transporter MerT family protein [Methylomonas sp. EFPC3]|nr:mercuric transporter MerT family protein [Methylomonas sp. EFPC3]WFP50405.1 mercuric transporter MerT family protein [Methylomonas sp. EFPC3]